MPLIIGETAGGVLIPVLVDDNGVVSVSADVVSLGRSYNKTIATGSGAITLSHTVSGNERLCCVTLHFNAAPTTSQAFTITLNSVAGSAYDTLLASVNPADEGLTDYVYRPEGDCFQINGDAIDLAFTNTNGKTYGVTITTENV